MLIGGGGGGPEVAGEEGVSASTATFPSDGLTLNRCDKAGL